MIYTATMRYQGVDRLDVTVKSAAPTEQCFTPTWDIVMGYKNKRISWPEYVTEYYRILNERVAYNLRHIRSSVDGLCYQAFFNDITLVCFCKNPARCHRSLLAHWLVANGPGNVVYAGERILA